MRAGRGAGTRSLRSRIGGEAVLELGREHADILRLVALSVHSTALRVVAGTADAQDRARDAFATFAPAAAALAVDDARIAEIQRYAKPSDASESAVVATFVVIRTG